MRSSFHLLSSQNSSPTALRYRAKYLWLCHNLNLLFAEVGRVQLALVIEQSPRVCGGRMTANKRERCGSSLRGEFSKLSAYRRKKGRFCFMVLRVSRFLFRLRLLCARSREAREVPNLTGLLVANTFMTADSLEAKDQPFLPNVIEKAVSTNLLITRTIDLGRIFDHLELAGLVKRVQSFIANPMKLLRARDVG